MIRYKRRTQKHGAGRAGLLIQGLNIYLSCVDPEFDPWDNNTASISGYS